LWVVSPVRATQEPRETQIMTVTRNPMTTTKFAPALVLALNSERSQLARKKAIITSAITDILGMTSDLSFTFCLKGALRISMFGILARSVHYHV